MTNSTKLPIRVGGIQPILSVQDMTVSRRFYVEKLGFTEEDWGDDNFTGVSCDGNALYLCESSQGNPGTWIWIGFDGDIFELYAQFRERGVKIRQSPVNYAWALEMQVEDPDGHVLRFGTAPNAPQPRED
jgi:catechol 2,3-dioxygenase-like lactoylglutathione lyase family enzyme